MGARPHDLTLHRAWEETPGHFRGQVIEAALSSRTLLGADAWVATVPTFRDLHDTLLRTWSPVTGFGRGTTWRQLGLLAN